MNDFEQTRLADEVAGLHQVVEALLEESCATCCCSSKDADDGDEEE